MRLAAALDDATKAGLRNDGSSSTTYASSIATYLGICASKASAFHCSLGRWRPNEGGIDHLKVTHLGAK